MALKQHSSIDVRFEQQYLNAKEYLLPFIGPHVALGPSSKVMEIGCAEGGVLKPFVEQGCFCLGVDLSISRINHAHRLMGDLVEEGKAKFLAQNVYDLSFKQEWESQFDLIILKDTIEHIPQQEKFIPYLKTFLKEDGKIFFGFPPWRMPFGGHQQICTNKYIAFFPYLHLLPASLYKKILSSFGESEATIKELLEIKSTGISIHRFESIMARGKWTIVAKKLFLFNPIYRYKFGVSPREQFPVLDRIPHLRDFYTTAGWYLVTRS